MESDSDSHESPEASSSKDGKKPSSARSSRKTTWSTSQKRTTESKVDQLNTKGKSELTKRSEATKQVKDALALHPGYSLTLAFDYYAYDENLWKSTRDIYELVAVLSDTTTTNVHKKKAEQNLVCCLEVN